MNSGKKCSQDLRIFYNETSIQKYRQTTNKVIARGKAKMEVFSASRGKDFQVPFVQAE